MSATLRAGHAVNAMATGGRAMVLTMVLAGMLPVAGCTDPAGPPTGAQGAAESPSVSRDTPPSEAAGGGLIEIPRPDLEPLEDAVREQIRAGEHALDAAVKAAGDHPADLVSPASRSMALRFGEQGKLYHAYRLRNAAEACYLNAQRLLPDDHRWPYYLAHLYLEDRTTERAVTGFRRALALRPAYPPALLHLARTYYGRGQPELAEPILRRMLSHNPRSAPALVVLGKLAAEHGDHRAAAEHFEAALRIDPEASEIHYPLGLAYRGLGDLERARHFLERRGGGKAEIDDPLLDELEALAGGMRLHQNRGAEAFLQGRYAAAAEHYRQAAFAAPDNAQAQANLASALTLLGRLDEARSHYQEALRIEPAHAAANRNYGTLLAQLGDDERAIVHYRKGLAADPGNSDGHYNLGNALRRQGRFEEAARHYRSAGEIDPRRRGAHLGLALSLIKLERWRRAAEVLEAAHATFPDDHPLTKTLARTLACSPSGAVRDGRRAHHLGRLLLDAETTLDHVETLAMALAELGHLEQAITLQRQALDAARGVRRPDLISRLSANLERYRAGRPCRAPWPPDDPVLAPGPR